MRAIACAGMIGVMAAASARLVNCAQKASRPIARPEKIMTYSVKEIYYTLLGEGAQTGRAAVFLRFAGCNLWTGLERDRAHAVCQFCDTDFVGTDGPHGGKFVGAEALASAVMAQWPKAI